VKTKPTERPILFSARMVRALLAGTKTQTRRIVKHQVGESHWKPTETVFWYHEDDSVPIAEAHEFCPYGQPGDRLWVRESLRRHGNHSAQYVADGSYAIEPFPWRWKRDTLPSIHCPRDASRITLQITSPGIRIERLQDITEEDCRAEGCAGGHDSIPSYDFSATPREHYSWLWKSINGVSSWNANPWVWVIEFKRLLKVSA
jgi:hypothetical protein